MWGLLIFFFFLYYSLCSFKQTFKGQCASSASKKWSLTQQCGSLYLLSQFLKQGRIEEQILLYKAIKDIKEQHSI